MKSIKSLWNTLSVAETGVVKLLDSGRQLYGTVVKHGVNDKTITVRVSSRHWNSKFKKPLFGHKNKQVHDQHNYCVTGDKVIIANCTKISKNKAYYVKTIVKPFPRPISQKQTATTATAQVQQNPEIQTKSINDKIF